MRGKKRERQKNKGLKRTLALALAVFVLLSLTEAPRILASSGNSTVPHSGAAAEQSADVYKRQIRFHVLANSDRTADQEIKLQVKDRLLDEMGVLLEGADTLDETRECLQENLPLLQEKAEETVRLAGSSQAVTVRLTTADFPVKTYGDYTFPAGRYETCLLYTSRCV